MALIPLDRTHALERDLVGRWYPRNDGTINGVRYDKTRAILEGGSKNTITEGIDIGTTGGYFVGDRTLDLRRRPGDVASQACTIAFWARADNVGNANAALVSWADAFSLDQIRMLWRFTGSNTVQAIRSGANAVISNPVSNVTDWNHYCITVNPYGAQACFINGDFDILPSIIPLGNGMGTKFQFGAWVDGDEFAGNIDNMALWHRTLSFAEICTLYNFGRTADFLKVPKFYVPAVSGPVTPSLQTALTQSESLTADLTVRTPAAVPLETTLTQSETLTANLQTRLDFKGFISQTETIGANLTVNVAGVVDLKTVLSQTEDLTADLTVIPPPQVALATTLTQTETIAADLTVNVPGMVSLQASLSQSESLAPNLSLLDPPPTLQTLLTQSESIFATLTIEGATAASAVEYRAPDLQTHYRAPDLQTNYRGT